MFFAVTWYVKCAIKAFFTLLGDALAINALFEFYIGRCFWNVHSHHLFKQVLLSFNMFLHLHYKFISLRRITCILFFLWPERDMRLILRLIFRLSLRRTLFFFFLFRILRFLLTISILIFLILSFLIFFFLCWLFFRFRLRRLIIAFNPIKLQSLALITQDLVGFIDFFELDISLSLLFLRWILMMIGMPLSSHQPVRFLDIFRWSISRYSQYLIVTLSSQSV